MMAAEVHPALQRMKAADALIDELRAARELLQTLNRDPLSRGRHHEITLRIRSIDKQLADAGVQP